MSLTEVLFYVAIAIAALGVCFLFGAIFYLLSSSHGKDMLHNRKIDDTTVKLNAQYQKIPLNQLKEERLRNYRVQQNGEKSEEPEELEESEKPEEPETEAEDPKNVGKEEIYPYKRKMLLTKTEYAFYQKLKAKCDENKYIICPKVRLEDIAGVDEKEIAGIVPDNKKDNLRGGKQRYRNHVKSSHIDFVICNSKLYLLAGLELDDKSHFSKKASDKDEQKNKIFNKIGLLLFRIPVEPEKYDEQIDKMLQVIKDKQKEEIEEYIKKKQMQDGGKALSNSFAPQRRSL